MKTSTPAIVLALIGILAGVELAEAQRTAAPQVGVRAAYDFDLDDFGLGAQAQIPLGRVLRLAPSGEVYLGDRTTWQANADVLVSLLLLRAGGGVALVDAGRLDPEADGGADVGLNLFVGLQSPRVRARFRPFVDARWTFIDGNTPFRLVAGVNVALGETARARTRPRRTRRCPGCPR